MRSRFDQVSPRRHRQRLPLKVAAAGSSPVQVSTLAAVLAAVAALAVFAVTSVTPAHAIATVVDLGTADSYSVLAGSTVTNTGPSELFGDLGVAPGIAITGFPPGTVDGETHAADITALRAQADLTTAYNDAAGQPSDGDIGDDFGNKTLLPGVYTATSSALMTGPLNLDAAGDPNAVFLLQIGTTLTTGSTSSVVLLNGAQACNVFWQVGSSATLGTNTTFVGTILARTSITALTGASFYGRALARNGAVTLDTNTFADPGCAIAPTVSPTASPTVTPTVTPTVPTVTPTVTPTVPTVTPTASPTVTPTAAPTVTPTGTPTSTGPTPPPPVADDTDTPGSATATSPSDDDSPAGWLANTGPGTPGPLLIGGALALLGGTALVLLAKRGAGRHEA